MFELNIQSGIRVGHYEFLWYILLLILETYIIVEQSQPFEERSKVDVNVCFFLVLRKHN